jgi:hypothetical protein
MSGDRGDYRTPRKPSPPGKAELKEQERQAQSKGKDRANEKGGVGKRDQMRQTPPKSS